MSTSSFRLSKNVYPNHYRIELWLNEKKEKFLGYVQLDLTFTNDNHQIYLHAENMQIQQVCRIDLQGKILQNLSYEVIPQEGLIRIDSMPVSSKEVNRLGIWYEATYGKNLHGLYQARDGEEFALCTQCESTYARGIFPCFDEPAFKATFEWIIHARKDWFVLTNGVLESSEEDKNSDYKTWYFQKTKPISSYLAALAVGEFTCLPPAEHNKIPLQVYALRGKEGYTEYAKNLSKQLMPWYERYFDYSYPFQKYDQVAVPGFDAGAMENAGLVIFRQNLLLLNEKTVSFDERKYVTLVISHEMAHMWFGNLVTMEWWDDLWLNEAFAEWIAHKSVHALKPEYKVWEGFEESKENALAEDSLESSHAIWTSVNTPAEALQMFDVITYQKGSAVLRMLERFLGEEAFCNGLKFYMKQFAWKNAVGEKLWNSLAAKSAQPVQELMKTWINQPGYPMIAVEYEQNATQEGASLYLQQKRFWSVPPKEPHSELQSLWMVPMVIRYQDEEGFKEHRLLFHTETMKESLSAIGKIKWLHANVEQSGFYRLNYSKPAVEHLLQNLFRLQAVEQRGILSDRWALIVSGGLFIDEYLRMIPFFAQTQESLVLREIVTKMRIINNLALQGIPQILSPMGKWLNLLFEKEWISKIQKMQGKNLELEDSLGLQTLSVLLGNLAKNSQVLTWASSIVEDEQKSADSVDANLAGICINLVAEQGNKDVHRRYVQVYIQRKEQKKSPQECLRYLRALPFFSSEDSVLYNFQLIEQNVIPQESVAMVLSQMLRNPKAQVFTWDYVKQRFATLMKSIGDTQGQHIVKAFGSLPPKFKKDVEFVRNLDVEKKYERSFQIALQEIEKNERLLLSNRDLLEHFFAKI